MDLKLAELRLEEEIKKLLKESCSVRLCRTWGNLIPHGYITPEANVYAEIINHKRKSNSYIQIGEFKSLSEEGAFESIALMYFSEFL